MNFIVVPALAYGAAELLISDGHPGLKTGLILSVRRRVRRSCPSSCRPPADHWRSAWA